jgi:hypothetical protein
MENYAYKNHFKNISLLLNLRKMVVEAYPYLDIENFYVNAQQS